MDKAKSLISKKQFAISTCQQPQNKQL